MAIKKKVSLTNNFGQQSEFPDCYIRIESISGDKQQITASVAFYDKEDGLKLIERSVFFAPKLKGDNFLIQAYKHLKELPEFEGAVDC